MADCSVAREAFWEGNVSQKFLLFFKCIAYRILSWTFIVCFLIIQAVVMLPRYRIIFIFGMADPRNGGPLPDFWRYYAARQSKHISADHDRKYFPAVYIPCVRTENGDKPVPGRPTWNLLGLHSVVRVILFNKSDSCSAVDHKISL